MRAGPVAGTDGAKAMGLSGDAVRGGGDASEHGGSAGGRAVASAATGGGGPGTAVGSAGPGRKEASSSTEQKAERVSRRIAARLKPWLLGAAAGYIDANTFLRFKVFGGFQTGNTVYLGISLQTGEVAEVCLYALLIVAFGFGTPVFLHASRVSKYANWLLMTIMACSIVIAEVLITKYDANGRWACILVSFALGIQNAGSFRGKLKQNTAYITGNLQKIFEAIYIRCAGTAKNSKVKFDVLTLVGIQSSYVLGAALAALAVSWHAAWSLLPAIPLLALALLSWKPVGDWYDRMERSHDEGGENVEDEVEAMDSSSQPSAGGRGELEAVHARKGAQLVDNV